jgi:HAMP domain-containing protein
MTGQSRSVGLKWKIGGIFTVVMLLLSALVIAAVYWVTQDTLREQLDKRARAIGTSFSDAAAAHVAANNVLALQALARKYTLLEGVAYAYVADRRGEVIAHTFRAFPEELRQELSTGGKHGPQRRELSLGERTVYETALPILEGQMGSVHVGFWADTIQAEIQRALVPIVGIIALVPFVGALLSFVLAHWILRPLVGLREVADRVTMGDLETCIGGKCITSSDEVGDLARSLERMRSSLRAAMSRLGREIA